MVRKYKAVIFDFDGTIVDSVSAYVNAYYDVLTSYGFDVSKKDIANLLGYSDEKIIRTLTKGKYDKKVLKEYRNRVRNDKFIEHLRLFEGVKDTLKYLYNLGVKLFIVSGSDKNIMEKVLYRYGIRSFFKEVISTRDDDFGEKPSPNAIEYIVEKYRLNKKEVVYVGDGILDYKMSVNASVEFMAKIGNYFNETNTYELGIKRIFFFDEIRHIFEKKVLCFVGMPGSGKSTIASMLKSKGFNVIRFGDITEDMLKKEGKKLNEANEREIREKIRKKYGMEAYAILNKDKIIKEVKDKGYAFVDGLYSWEEYLYLKESLELNVFLVGVVSDRNIRYHRLSSRDVRGLSREDAYIRDVSEIKKLNKALPIAMADYYIFNNFDKEYLRKQLEYILFILNI